MDKHEIAMKLMLEAIKQRGLQEPSGEGEEYNRNLAKIVAEMFTIIFEAVNNCLEDSEKFEKLSTEDVQKQLAERIEASTKD